MNGPICSRPGRLGPRPSRSVAPILLVLPILACGSTGSQGPSQHSLETGSSAAPVVAAPEVAVVFREGKAFAREGGREWPIAEVGQNEMLWAPDGVHFAYLKQASSSAPISSLLPAHARPRPTFAGSIRVSALGTPTYHIVIRNIRGDSVNQFPVYRCGKPTELDWIDNTQIGYLAPPDASGDAYVIHTAQSGEVVQVHRGRGFTWSPGRKHLAYVTGRTAASVRVDEETVWPRVAPGTKPGRLRILGSLAWSPDGQSLAFIEAVGSKGTLVVLLVLDNQQGDLSWPLPSGALDPEHRIFWAESKVTIGKSALHPRFAASWHRVR